jgi:hypothetical protein
MEEKVILAFIESTRLLLQNVFNPPEIRLNTVRHSEREFTQLSLPGEMHYWNAKWGLVERGAQFVLAWSELL